MMKGSCTTDIESNQYYRWLFDFSIDGDLRFISHHDTLRLFQRALTRADIPVRYSEGFNPQPKMSIPLPRPVGIASEAEFIIIETVKPVDPDDMLQRLNLHTSDDLTMKCVRQVESGEKFQPDMVRYRFIPEEDLPDDIESHILQILESDVVEVTRKNPEKRITRTIDIRPYLIDLRVDQNVIEWTLRVTGKGTAKPAEIAGLLGFDTNSINHRIRRMEVRWQ